MLKRGEGQHAGSEDRREAGREGGREGGREAGRRRYSLCPAECQGGTRPSTRPRASSSPPHQPKRRSAAGTGGEAEAHVSSCHVLCSSHDQHHDRGHSPSSPARPLATTLSRGGGAVPLATGGAEAAHGYGHLSDSFLVEERRRRCGTDPRRCLSLCLFAPSVYLCTPPRLCTRLTPAFVYALCTPCTPSDRRVGIGCGRCFGRTSLHLHPRLHLRPRLHLVLAW